MQLKETGTYGKGEIYNYVKEEYGYSLSYKIFMRMFLGYLEYNRFQEKKFNSRNWVYPKEYSIFIKAHLEFVEPRNEGEAKGK